MDHKKAGAKGIALNIINTFEIYIGMFLFIAVTVLLTVQVFSRYVLGASFAWTEELAQILFVWMLYCGIAAAVRKRKFLRIEFVLERVPFKTKRILLIFDNLIQATFNVFMIMPVVKIIETFKNSKTSLLQIPKRYCYIIIPVMLILTTIRIIQEIWVLAHESEKTLGVGEPLLDLEAAEQEYLASIGQAGSNDEGRKA